MFSVVAGVHRTRGILACIAVVLALCLGVGCGGVAGRTSGPSPGPPPSGPGGGGGQASAPPAKFVYALDATSLTNPAIAGFSINSSGVLTPIAGSPFSLLPHRDAIAMAATPATGFLYTAHSFDRTIEIFRADPNTGALSLSGTVSTPELQEPLNMITDAAGKFLFVADAVGAQVAVYQIAADGSLTPTPGSPFKTSAPIAGLTINTGGNLLYAAADNQIFGFVVGADGALAPAAGSPVTVRPPVVSPGKGPTGVGVALGPAGKFLFVADSTAPQTWVYMVGADGGLTVVAGSPFSTPGAVGILTVSPDGRFLFEGGFNLVAAFQVQANGSLVPAPGSPYANGPNFSGGAPVSQLATDPQGKFLLTSNIENSNITVFTIDQNTGALTNVSGSPFPVAPSPIGGGSPSRIAITH